MGSIQIDDIPGQAHENEEAATVKCVAKTNGTSFRSYEILDCTRHESGTLASLSSEIVLLSWLVVLLRNQEDSQISFEWAFHDEESSAAPERIHNTLAMSEVMTGLKSTIRESTAAIFNHITNIISSQDRPSKTPPSILLSTGSLSAASKEAKDEVTQLPSQILHRISDSEQKAVLHLEIRFGDGKLEIGNLWSSESMLQYTVTRHIETFAETIKMCMSNPDASIEDCIKITAHDLEDIWEWNHLLPPTYSLCMHEVISEKAQKFPDKIAIAAWDGDLTYSQIDRYSNIVALLLRDAGIKLHDIVPVCSEKSKWTIVAVLAVMKSGATFVLMDPTLPLARLQNMGEQVGAKMVLTSRDQYDLAVSIIPDGKFVVVEADTFTNSEILEGTPSLETVPPTALMYIIFTSGSTGTPKGVKISHETYTSSAFPRAKEVGYIETSRVLDFASYAFDVSIDSVLLTLGNGGCLCIPSDEDRLNDINGVIRQMQVNYAGLTPSVARILEPDVITSLSGLGLGGEAVSARDVALWGRDTKIIIGYGPCECTIGCTINGSAATGRDYISIGKGNGASMWIVDPNDHDTLMPVGAVGELLVEGPIVGQGYLNDSEKTAAAFIEDPSWLVAGHKEYAGRRGRLYKTGDLGRYDPVGSGGIVFVGRKDTQVKLRGQRVELGEIESQLRARLPSDIDVVAEVIVSAVSEAQSMLVAFIAPRTKGIENSELSLKDLSDKPRKMLSEAEVDVMRVLPRYMVPTSYLPVNYIPVLISGKTDRKRLRQFGATVDLRRLDQSKGTTADWKPNDLEKRLRQAWADTLKCEAENVRPDDNFFVLGGDSLTVMKLVSVCRTQGLELSVASAFGNPTLSGMAEIVQILSSEVQVQTPAFSMISQTLESARLEASQICESDQSCIEDIYACTPTQESLFTFSIKSTQVYVAQRVACIPPQITLDAWRNAWEVVVAASPILRTRLAQLQDPGLQQVVLKESISWKHSTNLKQYLETDQDDRMDLGQSLARYCIVESADGDKRYMVWTVHHVLYDGWSEPLILEKVSDALNGHKIKFEAHMSEFVRYVRDTDQDAMQEFWRQELKNADGPQFPRLPSRDYMPTPDTMLEHEVALQTDSGMPFTMATLIRGAWALVASQYTGSDDVVFGETLTGRDISLAAVESIIGPLIATVPVRVQVGRKTSVESYLRNVQQGVLARTPYQHMGMQNIRKVSRDAQYACETGTGLVIQPQSEYAFGELGFDQGDAVREALHFNPYPLMLAFGIRKGGFRVCASFDSSLIEVSQMEKILTQLGTVCAQLVTGLSRMVDEMSSMPASDLDKIWEWNKNPPLCLGQSTRKLRAGANVKQGSIYPPVVVHWVCDPRNPSLLSPIGSVGELWLEGAFLSDETVDSPSWLVAGSSSYSGRTGTVQATGDLVTLREDNSLVFVGRKEDILPVHGHAIDIPKLEIQFANYLPKESLAAVAILKSSSESGQNNSHQELIVFVEQQSLEGDGVELTPVDQIIIYKKSDSQPIETTIRSRPSSGLVVALKKLVKFASDSLPSYMIPSAYIVVDQIPLSEGQIDHSLLNLLASEIPQEALAQFNEGLNNAWETCLTEGQLTIPESVLQSSWATILGIAVEKIDADDNFFRLGGDSVLAMKLVSRLREQGYSLSVADIFRKMRLGDAAKAMKVYKAPQQKTLHYKPFSTLGIADVDDFLSKKVKPKLSNTQWVIQDALPVTDSQALDIRATIQGPRTSIQYTMLYFDYSIDTERLIRACNDLVKTHEILRTVFVEHESRFIQTVVDTVGDVVKIENAEGNLEGFVSQLCAADIELDFQLGSSFLKISFVENTDGKGCLVLRLSHAQYDGISLPKLLKDLETLYTGGIPSSFRPFSAYMAQLRNEDVQNKAIKYWRGLLLDSPFSALPGNFTEPTDKSIFKTKLVDISKRPEEITMANLLTAAWAQVLSHRLQTTDVTFGSITSGRSMNLANVEDIMGPCYQITPVRVPVESQRTDMDLMRFVQKQSAESAAYDYLGFEKISKQCTKWPIEARFFDSIVHYQDFEDFDTMPFADGTCRVEILNPHGDAAHPLKVVSFVRKDEAYVGIVGSERDPEFVETVLDELAVAFQELAGSPATKVLQECYI